jgi:hypothetical protein
VVKCFFKPQRYTKVHSKDTKGKALFIFQRFDRIYAGSSV